MTGATTRCGIARGLDNVLLDCRTGGPGRKEAINAALQNIDIAGHQIVQRTPRRLQGIVKESFQGIRNIDILVFIVARTPALDPGCRYDAVVVVIDRVVQTRRSTFIETRQNVVKAVEACIIAGVKIKDGGVDYATIPAALAGGRNSTEECLRNLDKTLGAGLQRYSRQRCNQSCRQQQT